MKSNMTSIWRPGVIGCALGLLSWSGDIYGLIALPFLALLWARISQTRLEAFVGVLSYYLAAAWCQIPGISAFWAPTDGLPAIKEALVVWLGANLILAAIWAILWARTWQGLRLIAVFVVLSLPPIGVIGWASPLTGAGIWFPWMGWYGLGLFVALMALLAAPGSHGRTISISILTMAAVLVNLTFPASPSAGGWIGLNTNFGAARDFAGEYGRLLEVDDHIRKTLRAGRPETILLPEAVGGSWPISRDVFELTHRAAARRQVTVLIGARELVEGGKLVNAVYSIGAEPGHRWVNRVPVPAGLWKPGDPGSAVTWWWDSGVQIVNGRRIGSLICYEQLLVWPVLFSAAAGAEILVAPSNLWFGMGTPLPRIQHNAASSWGRLFGMPVVFANNS